MSNTALCLYGDFQHHDIINQDIFIHCNTINQDEISTLKKMNPRMLLADTRTNLQNLQRYSHIDGYKDPTCYRYFYMIYLFHDVVKKYEIKTGKKYDYICISSFKNYQQINHAILSDHIFHNQDYSFIYGSRNTIMEKFSKNILQRLDDGFRTSKLITGKKSSCGCGNVIPFCKLNIPAVMLHLGDLYNYTLSPVMEMTNIYKITDMDNITLPSDINIVLVPDIKKSLKDTISTMTSIKKYIPNSFTILLQAAQMNIEEISLIQPYTNLIILYDEDINANKFCKYKSMGETYLLLKILQYLPHTNRIFKLTGRYRLNDQFNLENTLHEDKISCAIIHDQSNQHYFYNKSTNTQGFNVQHCINTTFYTIPPSLIGEYQKAMILSLQYLQKAHMNNIINVDIEHTLYNFLNHEHVYNLYRLGVEGRMNGQDEIEI